MSYLLSFSLLKSDYKWQATYQSFKSALLERISAGGSLVGESILSRYDRHRILQEIRLHSWLIFFIEETNKLLW